MEAMSVFEPNSITKLLLEKGADPNIQNSDGETALYLAARYSNKGMAKLLIEKGADINVQNSYGETPLMGASLMTFGDYEGVTKLLLEKNADPKIKDNLGKTALDKASSNRIVELLK